MSIFDLEFPRWVYKGFGAEMKSQIANDPADFQAAMAAGWRPGVEDAEEKHLYSDPVMEAEPEQEAEQEDDQATLGRKSLEESARNLGIRFSKSTSDARLYDLISRKEGE